jgi:polyisoprenoid-binding protein YceI
MNRLSKLVATSLIFLPWIALAEVAKWEIVPSESSVRFTATQNNAPVSGTFKKLHGNIEFSPEDLKNSKVDLVVEMDSVNASYQELVSTLKTSDWLDVSKFKDASFKSNELTKIKDNTYQAKGELQIRDKKQPLTVQFTIDNPAKDKSKVVGETAIKRTAFGIGQGDWASTDEVKDDVKLNFDLSLKRQ